MPSIGGFELLLILCAGALLVLWLYALLDCALNEPPNIDKLVWEFIILSLNVVGAAAYLLLRRPRRGSSPSSRLAA